jgi:glycosyltransferase involved in cell wall biosynthesis
MKVHEMKPLVSIGLPVYNGGRYLAEAIESILSQTYRHFELIIRDNASTDDTEQICRRFAALDHRIRYFRNAANLGLSRNFNLTAERASGKYFRWAACDDHIAPEYLARCVEALEADATIVLCHSQVRVIGENGEEVANFDYESDYAASQQPLG